MLDDLLSVAVGKKAEVPDLYKSTEQHVRKKPPDELHGIQGHLFHPIVVT